MNIFDTMMKQKIVKKQLKEEEKQKRDLEEIAYFARKEKAERMLYAGAVTRVVSPIEIYHVASQTKKDVFYRVKCFNTETFRCECKDFERQIQINKNHKCKHIVLVELAEERGYIKKKLHEDSWKGDEYSF